MWSALFTKFASSSGVRFLSLSDLEASSYSSLAKASSCRTPDLSGVILPLRMRELRASVSLCTSKGFMAILQSQPKVPITASRMIMSRMMIFHCGFCSLVASVSLF